MLVIVTGKACASFSDWTAGTPSTAMVRRQPGWPFTSSRGTSLLEIKFPFKGVDEKLIDHQNETAFLRYIKYVDGKLTLWRSHKYYTQVQLLMYICGIHECFFLFVYSHKHSVTVVVDRDDSFLSESVWRLADFYFSWLLPVFAAQQRL